MKVVGLTGGIGSGKSTVAKLFEELGVPTYDSDSRAKFLMNHDPILQKQIKFLLGSQAYNMNIINRKWIARKVFNDEKLLYQLNNLVHPIVRKDFEKWMLEQKKPYILKETAILIESGFYKDCDQIIVVTAELECRIKRLQLRDNSSLEEIQNRVQNQINEEDRLRYANYIVENNSDLNFLKREVLRVHKKILKLKQ